MFDSDREYKCNRGMKFVEDFALDKQIGTCRKENKWDVPTTFYHCVESAYIREESCPWSN